MNNNYGPTGPISNVADVTRLENINTSIGNLCSNFHNILERLKSLDARLIGERGEPKNDILKGISTPCSPGIVNDVEYKLGNLHKIESEIEVVLNLLASYL